MSDQAKPATPPLDHAGIRAILIGALFAGFLSALEQTIVGPALPTIGRTLSDADNLSWVVTAYLLAATAMTPLFGKLSDIYGRRVLMLVGLGIFVAGSVGCALAPDMPTLIAARAVQGIGGGGILPLVHVIVGDMVSPKERARYQAYTASMFLIACIVGPLLGGVLTDYVHWTMIFWINVPFGLLAMVMCDRMLRRLPRNDRPHKLDLLGAALMVCATLAMLLALTWGGTRYPWTSPVILGLFAGSVALWLLFAWWQAAAPEPFVPFVILRNRTVAAMSVSAFCSIGTVVGLSIFLPLYLELVAGFSPSGSGGSLIVFMVATAAGSFFGAQLVVKIRRYKRAPYLGTILGCIMLVGFALQPAGLSLAWVLALLSIGGFGFGMLYPVSTLIVQNAVELHQLGTATGLLNFFRLLGGAIIVAVFGAIVLGGVDAAGLKVGMPSGTAPTDFAESFRWVFVVGAALLALGLLALIAVEEHPMRGPAEAVAVPPAPAAAE
jgi:MFS family permease